MRKIYCDDGSTNVKLAWNEGNELKTFISSNSFRHGWKVSDLNDNVFNYEIGTLKYTWDSVSSDAISTTNVEYQYGDLNLLSVHHALLNSGIAPQKIDLTVTLPLSEYYDHNSQKNIKNIERKKNNLLRNFRRNNKEVFHINSVEVMPESLPAAFSRLEEIKPTESETTLIIDLGGTTLDAGVIVGQFDDITAIHGNSRLGVSLVTRATQAALKNAESETSPLIADKVIKNRHDREFLKNIINNNSKIEHVIAEIENSISALSSLVINDLARFRNVNRIFLVGGGAYLIEGAIRQSWSLQHDRIEIIPDPQLSLAREIALYKNEG